MKLCVIPARGGSKRIPRKNIRPFAGRPMLTYAVDAAQQSCQFDAIVVSSDDEEILSLSEQLGAKPLLRPSVLADDFTSTVAVIAHAIEVCQAWGWQPQAACCIYPTVPLLRGDDLIGAWEILQRSQADYVFPVAVFPSAIQRALRLDSSGRLTPFYPKNESSRTQDLEPAYYDAGQYYWGRLDAWLAGRAIHSNGQGIVLPSWRVVDIDTADDWERAELIYRALFMEGKAA